MCHSSASASYRAILADEAFVFVVVVVVVGVTPPLVTHFGGLLSSTAPHQGETMIKASGFLITHNSLPAVLLSQLFTISLKVLPLLTRFSIISVIITTFLERWNPRRLEIKVAGTFFYINTTLLCYFSPRSIVNVINNSKF